MNRYLCALFLTIFVLLTMTAGALAAADTDIPFQADILQPEEVIQILNKIDGFQPGVLEAIYKNLIANDPDSVPAMRYATAPDQEGYADSLTQYGDWIVHFVLKASKDVTVIPIGYYWSADPFNQEFAVALPPMKLKANEEHFVMDHFMQYWPDFQNFPYWPGSYELIDRFVREFRCIAIPVSNELIDLIKDSDNPDIGQIATIDPMLPDTSLSLSLNLYELVDPDTGKLGECKPVSTKTFLAPWPDPQPAPAVIDLPQTGDSSSLTLWLALGLMSLLIFVKMRSSVRIAKDL